MTPLEQYRALLTILYKEIHRFMRIADMEEFYFLSRAILVKDEKHYDKGQI